MTQLLGALVGGREVYSLGGGMTIREAARHMTEKRVGAICVLEGERLVGLLSERDIMSRVVARGLDPDRTVVREVMTRELVVAREADAHEDGVRKMRQAGCRHLPVMRGERLLGLVSLRDLLQVDLDHKVEEIRWLNSYIHFVPPGTA